MNDLMQTKFNNYPIKNIFPIENTINLFRAANFTPEIIAEIFVYFNERTRAYIEFLALYLKDTAPTITSEALVNKIDEANEIFKQKRITDFKISVLNGTHEEFLSTLSWSDKCVLKVNMNFTKRNLSSERNLTKEEENYYNILESSIKKDFENEAYINDFDSIETLRRCRRKISSRNQ